MCLYINETATLKVAKERITAFKVLAVKGYKGYYESQLWYLTPFQNNKVRLGGEYKAKDDIDRFCRTILPDSAFKDYPEAITCGVIHTFKTFEGAMEAVCNSMYFWNGHYVIVKAYIPKGTEYYEGIFELTGIPALASTKIRYSKTILYHQ